MGTHPPASALGSRLIQLESLHSVNWEIWFLFSAWSVNNNYFHFLVCKYQAKIWIHWTCRAIHNRNYLSKLFTENDYRALFEEKSHHLVKPGRHCSQLRPMVWSLYRGTNIFVRCEMVPVERNKYICNWWNVCRSLSLHIMWYVLMKESSWAGMCWAPKLMPVSRTLWLRR